MSDLSSYVNTANFLSSTLETVKTHTIKIAGFGGADAVVPISDVSGVQVANTRTGATVFVSVGGKDHVYATFKAKRLSEVLPEVAGTDAADLPDPKSLKKARKKARRVQDELLDLLGWERPA